VKAVNCHSKLNNTTTLLTPSELNNATSATVSLNAATFRFSTSAGASFKSSIISTFLKTYVAGTRILLAR
jgi:hypothetical protein